MYNLHLGVTHLQSFVWVCSSLRYSLRLHPYFVFESMHPYPLCWDDPSLLGTFLVLLSHHLDYTPVNLVWAFSLVFFGWTCTAGVYIPANLCSGPSTPQSPLYFRLIARQPAHLFIFGSTVCSPPVLLNLFHLVIQMLPHLFATLLLDMRTIGIYLIWHDGAIDCY